MKQLTIDEMSFTGGEINSHNTCILLASAGTIITALSFAVPGLALAYEIAACFGLFSGVAGMAACVFE